MKINPALSGYFKNGQFFPLNQNLDDVDLYSGLNFDTKELIGFFKKNCHDNLTINLVCMPDLIGNDDIIETNIFLIYREAYFSIAFGNYNAGLLLLGQLLEVITKEIILINTGKTLPKATFGNAIKHAEGKKILHPEDVRFLKEFNENIRNVYSHYKLSEIIGPDTKVPLWKIPFDSSKPIDPEKFLNDLIKVQAGIRAGQHQPTFANPFEIPTIAAVIKENIDRKRSILWLWAITLKLDQFFKIYLTIEKYQAYIEKFKKIPYSEIPPISLE